MIFPSWTLADRIRKAREHAGLKQEDLAQKMETTRQTLGRWENGTHTPTEKNLQALAESTGVPLEWFHLEEEPAPIVETQHFIVKVTKDGIIGEPLNKRET